MGLQLTWNQPSPALTEDVVDGPRAANFGQQPTNPRLVLTPLSWTVGCVTIPGDASGVIAEVLSLVDLAKFAVVSRESRCVTYSRMRKLLCKFVFRPDIIGFNK